MLVKSFLAGGLLYAGLAAAQSVVVDNSTPQQCAGVWGSKGWPADRQSKVEVTFTSNEAGSLAFAIYEYEDALFFSGEADSRQVFCDQVGIEQGYCSEAEFGSVLQTEVVAGEPRNQILIQDAEKLSSSTVTYEVPYTGYYCVSVFPSSKDFSATVSFTSAHGKLAGTDLPLLNYYDKLWTYYAQGLAVWILICFLYWRRLFPKVLRSGPALLPGHWKILKWGVVSLVYAFVFNSYLHFINGAENTHTQQWVARIVVALFTAAITTNFAAEVLDFMEADPNQKPIDPSFIPYAKVALFVSTAVLISRSESLVSTPLLRPILLVATIVQTLAFSAFIIWTLQAAGNAGKRFEASGQTYRSQIYNLVQAAIGTVLLAYLAIVIPALAAENYSYDGYNSKAWRIKWFFSRGWTETVYGIVFAALSLLFFGTTVATMFEKPVSKEARQKAVEAEVKQALAEGEKNAKK